MHALDDALARCGQPEIRSTILRFTQNAAAILADLDIAVAAGAGTAGCTPAHPEVRGRAAFALQDRPDLEAHGTPWSHFNIAR
jgi:hypothetical protein